MRRDDVRGWLTSRAGKTIASAASVVATGVAVRGTGFAKELTVAATLGVGSDLDAALIAVGVVAVLTNFISGSFYAAIVPRFAVMSGLGDVDGQRHLSTLSMIWASLAGFGAAALLMAVSFPLVHLIAPSVARSTELWWYLLMAAPSIGFAGLMYSGWAVLNAGRHFALPAFIPILTPLVTLFLLRQVGLGALSIPVGLTVGAACEAGVMVWVAYRNGLMAAVSKLWRPDLRAILRDWWALALLSPVLSGTALGTVDQLFAATVAPGTVSTLGYAMRIPAVVISIVGLALVTAVVPTICADLSRPRNVGGGRDWIPLVGTAAVVGIVAGGALAFFAPTLVELAFTRGAFHEREAAEVSFLMRFYAAQVPLYLLATLFGRVLLAVKGTTPLRNAALLALGTSIIGNSALIPFFGAVGVALSGVLVQLALCVFLALSLKSALSSMPRVDGHMATV